MDDRNVRFEITGRTEDIFSHAPLVGPPPLPDGEAFIVGKAKLRRPVIVLAGEGFELLAGPQVAKPSDTFLCAPVYGGDQYPEEMRKRVRAYEYSNFFYLPESKAPLFREGMVRFDHIQAIRRDHLRNRARAQLTADALLALQDWLFHYLTGRLSADSLIGEYRTGGTREAEGTVIAARLSGESAGRVQIPARTSPARPGPSPAVGSRQSVGGPVLLAVLLALNQLTRGPEAANSVPSRSERTSFQV